MKEVNRQAARVGKNSGFHLRANPRGPSGSASVLSHSGNGLFLVSGASQIKIIPEA
jgi:hypothetical protein